MINLQGKFMSFLAVFMLTVTSAAAATAGRIDFVPDGFDYTADNLEKFTYSYVDESTGSAVTVPITQPATSEAAIKALLREVFTNREIPGRKWIFDGDYVDYTIDPVKNALAMETFGIAAGDYTPYRDGLTCLLVEGVDELDDYSGGLEKIKCVTLVTSRMVVEADNFIANPDGSPALAPDGRPLSNPGYLFNIKKPLYKFYFITKGKPRRLMKEIVPLCNLYEEYSPNDGNKETQAINAYASLIDGTNFKVSHDCSSVMANRGHITKVQSIDGAAAVSINISLFIPFYRNYDDSGRTNYSELYTWYDPVFEPFLYYYAIKLQATVQPSLGSDDFYDVNLEWTTNFRQFFHTAHEGEFWVYKVIDGVIDMEPIVGFVSTPDPDVTSFDPVTGCVLSHSPDGVRVTYREPVTEQSRTIYYIVAGRPAQMDCDLTHSNVDRVWLPGSGQDQAFVVNISGTGLSDFNMVKGWNSYTNVIEIHNRNDEFAFTSEMLRTSGEFVVLRESENDTEAGAVGYLTVDKFTENDTAETYYCSMLDADRAPVTDDSDIPVKVVLTADKDGPDAGLVKSSTDDELKLFEYVDRFDEKIQPDNTHPSYYTYKVSYEAPSAPGEDEVSKGSNVETVNIYKSMLDITPITYSREQIDLDQQTPFLSESGYQARIEVTSLPEVLQFRLRGKGYTETVDDSANVFAIIQNNEGTFDLMMPNAEGLYAPVGESVKASPGMPAVITVPLSPDQWQQSDYFVVEACTESPVATYDAAERHYETFGSPSVAPDNLPQLLIGTPRLKQNLANPGWWINHMELYTDITDNGSVGSSRIEGVYGYALWRHTAPRGSEELTSTLLHNSDNPKPYEAPGYIYARYDTAPSDAFGYLTMNTRDGLYDPEQALDVYYQGRVYLEVSDGVPFSAYSDSSPRYMVLEDTQQGVYSGSTTSIGNIGVDDETAAADAAPQYFTIDGMRVSSPSPGGIYIVRRGAVVTKERF